MSISRRSIIQSTLALSAAPMVLAAKQATPATVDTVERLVIDFPAEPVNINPAMAYSDLEWSIVHSIFDAVVGFDAEGELRPVAADEFTQVDAFKWEVKLRADLRFHDGSAVTADAVARGFDLVNGSESLVSDIFSVVDSVEVVDDLTARIMVSSPTPWLPAQMAAWHVLIPENFDPAAPVGSGPFVFDHWSVGEELVLGRFDAYQPTGAKGTAISNEVVYHFVPEATTRISNALSGSTDIASFLPIDALSAVDGENATLRSSDVAGTWFVRIATDTAPFDDVRVRKALNLALDLDSIVGVLVHEGSNRLASLFPSVGMGFNPDLAPFEFDPDAARALLAEAGFADGLEVQLEVASDASLAVCEALVGQWAEVGINAELVVSDLGTFNASWTDAEAPVLRMASWSPMFDPATLLNLVWDSEGILSRTQIDAVDELIAAGGERFGEERVQTYQDLGAVMQDEAAAVFLWNLMHVAAVSASAENWTPRPDQWIMALAR